MSSSPFDLFRRNLKPMMVFLTLLALVSFVVLPSIAMYQQNQTGYGVSAATSMATFDGGEYDLTKVSYFTRNHFAAVRFLRELADSTMARGGVPKVADFQYNTQQKFIQSLGINSNPSDESTVRTLMFAGEAKKAGLDLDDTAIRNWLTLYSDGRLSDSEINGVLATSSANKMGQVQLYEQLRTHLLATAYQRQVMGGLTASGQPIMSPAEQWELFLRLNRRTVADAYAVNVADFIEKTNAKPAEKDISAVYEEGKSTYPDDQSPKPAFRRPYTANIEYLAGSLNDFIDRERATLTEEQLRAEYQNRLDGGDFKLPSGVPTGTEPAAPATEAPVDATSTEAAPPTDAPAKMDAPVTETPVTETPVTEAMPETKTEPAPATTEAPQVDLPQVDSPQVDPPATEVPSEIPAADTPNADTPNVDAPPVDAPAVEVPAAKPADSSGLELSSNGIRLVAMQADDAAKPAETTAADAAVETAAEVIDPNTPTDAETVPAEPAKAAEMKADPAPAEPATTEAPDAPTSEKPAAPAETADAPATPADAPVEEKPAASTNESFEKVRDDIARTLAMKPALDKLDAAVTEVNKTMRTYFNARAIAGEKAAKDVVRPDLKSLAEKLGMKHVVTGMMNGREIQNDPISLSAGAGTGMQRGEGFVQAMYVARPQLFTPIRTVDDQAQISYIAWKSEEQAEFIPELKNVREEVITAIRMAEARSLAQTEAENKAKEFAASDKPVKELIPTERSSMYFESLGPFSWMNSLGFGMRAFMGNVPELDNVGETFMRQVFTSDRGKWGVAANMPETVYYVVRPTEFSPSTDELHQRFTQLSQRMQTMSLAVEEAIKIRDGHYEALDKRIGFKWNEEALKAE